MDAETQAFGLSSAAALSHWQGAKSEVEQLGLQWVLICNGSVIGSYFAHYVIMLVPYFQSLTDLPDLILFAVLNSGH